MIDYTKLSSQDLNRELVKACESGDLELAKYLVSSNELPVHADITHNKWIAIKSATASGQIDVVKYFLEDIQNHYPNIVFYHACQNGQLEILKLVYEATDFKSEKDSSWYYGGLSAASSGQVNIIDYFLTSKEFILFVKNNQMEDLFTGACNSGQINVVEYLANLPKFIQNNSLNNACNKGMIVACDSNETEMMKYLIFNLNMTLKENTKEHLIKAGRNDILDMFNIRELRKDLHTDLNKNLRIHNEQTRKIKI
jgi:hypothetical protein